MTLSNCHRLAVLIASERDAILVRWRQSVREIPSAQGMSTPALDDHMPGVLEELAEALRTRTEESIASELVEGSPPLHGLQRFHDGFRIEEVVAEYNLLRGCIHDLAEMERINLQGTPFRIINSLFDQAIGLAVRTFAMQKTLEEQERRAEYLAFVAHDLRTPISAISLAARVLDTTMPRDKAEPETGRMLSTLRRNVRHLSALVDKVVEENVNLVAEAGVKLERRELDLWPLVEALVHDMRPLALQENARVVNRVAEEAVAWADAGLLRRILQNLILNAVQNAPDGEVVVGAERFDGDDTMECWVRDDGKGIPEARQALVFDKNETDSPGDAGAGLGLAIVKSFVEAHGGTVTLESVEGKGSTFRFTLPGRLARPANAGGDGR